MGKDGDGGEEAVMDGDGNGDDTMTTKVGGSGFDWDKKVEGSC